MTPLRFSVDVIIERVPLANRWASERWQPVGGRIAAPRAGVPPARDVIPGTGLCVPEDPSGNRWRCTGFEIELHPTEAEGYYLNITRPTRASS